MTRPLIPGSSDITFSFANDPRIAAMPSTALVIYPAAFQNGHEGASPMQMVAPPAKANGSSPAPPPAEAVAEFERALILERTMAGLAVARADGKVSGRKRSMTPQDIEAARRRMAAGELKAREAAKLHGISERSLWRNLRWASDVEALKA